MEEDISNAMEQLLDLTIEPPRVSWRVFYL